MSSDLIVVADWRPSVPSATSQLMSRLLLDRQLLWVDAAAFRPERAAPRSARTAGMAPTTAAPFPVLSAEDLGGGSHPLARLVSPRLLTRRVERVSRRRGLRHPMLWLASPWAAPMLDGGYAGPVIYQPCAGPPAADAAAARESAALEERILARADLVLPPAREHAAAAARAQTRLLPAGVDLELFSTRAQPARDLPTDGPVAGCHGCFDETFDADLLAAIARRLPDWHFMLLGPVCCDLSMLGHLANVRMAGIRPQDQLPRYLQFWTASLLLRRPAVPPAPVPPLPFLETLAAGLPTVAAGAYRFGGYADLSTCVDDADGAAAALQAAAAEPRERRALRRKRVANDALAARAAVVSRLLGELEAASAPGTAARLWRA
ncbi:hypothetical protein [Thiohalocapsa halophila]|nr:hypothetical protein [Thiohalocapsa halophila]